MAVPTNKRDVQVLLGMIGYYKRFIPKFSSIGDPLFHLLKIDTPFEWSPACQKAFELLKQALMEEPVLAYPDSISLSWSTQTPASLLLVVFSHNWIKMATNTL